MTVLTKLVNGEEIPLTDAEIIEYNNAIAAHEAAMAEVAKYEYRAQRLIEYPTIDSVVVAIMESLEGNTVGLDAVKALRAAVKAKYPKLQDVTTSAPIETNNGG